MKQAAKWTAIIALFTIPFLPLYVSNELFFPFITGKAFAFRILVEIALAAYVLLALMDKRYRPRFSWTLVIFGGFVAWMFAANLLGVNPVKAFWSNFERMDGWLTLVHIFALFIVTSAVLTVEKLWRKWWTFFVSVAALVCGYGLIQLAGGAEIHQGGIRLTASLGNAIYLAVYLMFAIFAAGWLALTSHGWRRYALFVFMALAAFILFFTGSRGPLVGLAVGVGFGAVLWLVLALRGNKDDAIRLGIKVAAGALVLLTVAAGTLFLGRESAVVQENFMLSRAASVFNLGDELRVRGTIWNIAMQGAAEAPITGWGQEGFNQVFNKYYDPSLYKQEAWFDRAHNMYLDWLVAGGVPALVLFLALLVAAAFALLRTNKWSREKRILLIAALVAYAVQALVVFDNLFSYVPLVMLFAMAHASSARPVSVIENAPELKGDTPIGLATAAIGAVAVIVIWMVNVPNIAAANHLVYALSPSPRGAEVNLELFKDALADGSFASQEIREQLILFATRLDDKTVSIEVRDAFAQLALTEMGREVERSPNDARLRIQYASAFDLVGNKEGRLAQIDEAIRLSPKKQALHLNRGFALYELGRLEEARIAFTTAYEFDPSFDSVAMQAASGLLVIGDAENAKALLLESIGTTTPDNDALFFAYYQAKQWDEMIGVALARVQNENGSLESRLRLTQAYAAASRFTDARAELDALTREYPNATSSIETLRAQIFRPAL